MEENDGNSGNTVATAQAYLAGDNSVDLNGFDFTALKKADYILARKMEQRVMYNNALSVKQSKVMSWSLLEKIQRIKLIKSMYIWLILVPIIAKSLSKVEEVANVKVFEYSFALDLGLPFSWKVFYFSALCFAAANLIYLLRCYLIVKEHRNYSEFKEAGKGVHQLQTYAADVGFEVDIPAHGVDEIQQPFWEVYDRADLGRSNARMICSVLYGLGFMLIGCVLFQNLLAVLKVVLNIAP